MNSHLPPPSTISLSNLREEQLPLIMGILNITPDSFSDGGCFTTTKSALKQADYLLASGAIIIDVGGESTGPGSTQITAEEEISRISAIIKELAPLSILSIDTYKAKTAEFALSAGAKIINDVSALRADPNMLSVVRDFNAYVVLMYSKENNLSPHAKSEQREYDNIVKVIAEFLEQRIDFALNNGIREDKVILDPGMGTFISSIPKYSWEILQRFQELKALFKQFHLLIGTSRKGFLGGNISERDPLSQLTAFTAFQKGATIIRTHNPKMMKELLQLKQQPG